MGYLTALNGLSEDTYNALGEMTLEAALEWLDGYCDLNKLDSYERAIKQLVTAHYAERQRSPRGRSGGWGRAMDEPDNEP